MKQSSCSGANGPGTDVSIEAGGGGVKVINEMACM
jgi:hypothetical protein